MDHPEARKWAEDFESKNISELGALRPPDGMYTHVIRHWQKARLAAIAARQAPLNDARQTLAQQIAARAAQLAPAENAQSIALSGADETPVIDDEAEDAFDEDAAHGDSGDIENEAFDPDSMTHEEKVENLRARLAAAIARNNAPVPEPVFRPLQAQAVLPRTSALEAMEIQMTSSASMVEGITRQFREEEFSASMVCEVMKSMAVLVAANAALGKVVYHFQNDSMDLGTSGRRSNAS